MFTLMTTSLKSSCNEFDSWRLGTVRVLNLYDVRLPVRVYETYYVMTYNTYKGGFEYNSELKITPSQFTS